MKPIDDVNQKVTIRLNRRTLRKAKILAAKHDVSISQLIAQYIETLVGQDDTYERAQRQALASLDRGFHLGGEIVATRDEWHQR